MRDHTTRYRHWRLAAAIAVIPCFFGALPAGVPSFLAAAAQAQSRETQRFSIAIRHRQVEPAMRVVRAQQDDRVEIAITSDEAAELHLHGYDIVLTLEPGKPAIINLVAKIAGRFSLEAHRFGAPGAAADTRRQREVTLLYLEIYPR